MLWLIHIGDEFIMAKKYCEFLYYSKEEFYALNNVICG